jgi:hypothetical protein
MLYIVSPKWIIMRYIMFHWVTRSVATTIILSMNYKLTLLAGKLTNATRIIIKNIFAKVYSISMCTAINYSQHVTVLLCHCLSLHSFINTAWSEHFTFKVTERFSFLLLGPSYEVLPCQLFYPD